MGAIQRKISFGNQTLICGYSFVMFMAIGLASCTPKASTTATDHVTYQEDLSIYRSQYDIKSVPTEVAGSQAEVVVVKQKANVTPVNHIKTELDSINSILIASRRDVEFVDGFNIQLYSGNDRDKANEIMRKSAELLTELTPWISYEQPNYKVKVGPYFSRIEANVHFNKLKSTIERAVLVPAKIKIESN